MTKKRKTVASNQEIKNLPVPPPENPRRGPPPTVEPPVPLPPIPKPTLEIPDDTPPDFLAGWKAQELRKITLERARRKIEALRLYEPLMQQQQFHASMAPERILRGSNRGGKTLPAAVEVARAVTGQDPVDGRYPKIDGRCFCIGKDLSHVGQVMWRKLSRAGAFKIIRDEHSGAWRAFRPWDTKDLARAAQAKPAPPLIPARLIKEIAWENKKESIPKVVKLHNGWEIAFYSSLGAPPNGVDVDLVWFDEEIDHQEWYPEMSARLLDRAGRFVWSATPQAGTEQLYALHERAEELGGTTAPLVEEFVILLGNNPHISEEQKRQLRDKLTEEDVEVRIEGQFAITNFRVFPEWDRVTHRAPWFDIPKHWTRYAAIDPGRQICAVLFVAVPPPDEEVAVYLFDELYIKNCNAKIFGAAMAEKTKHQQFQAFVIDHHEGRKAETGSGMTIEYQYAAALRDNKVSSVITGHGFLWGSDDVDSRIEMCRSQLLIGESGKPKLRAILEKVPNFDWEMRHYRYKREPGLGTVTDKPQTRGRVHLMACWGYLAMHGCGYVKPKGGKATKSAAVKALLAKRARQRERNGSTGAVNLGPGRSYA